jgi:hypothetical protein
MFFEVFLHLMAHKLATHKWSIEFHNMHESGVNNALTLSGASYPLLRVGSLFVPFIFIEFRWTPLIIAWFLTA